MTQPKPPPGPLVAAGFFIVAGCHLMLAAIIFRFELLSILEKLYGLGLLAGGITMAMGWARALAYPRQALRTIGVLGIVGAVLQLLFGLLSMASMIGFGMFWVLFEVLMCVTAIVGAYLWRNAASRAVILASLACGAFLVTSFSMRGWDSEWSFFFNYGVVPAAAWALAGVAALSIRPQRTAAVPTAIVVK
jgi:hypothetical protein